MTITYKNTILLLLLFIGVKTYSCDCKTITISEEFKISDMVFLGEVIKKEGDFFYIKPYEVFKGHHTIKDVVFKALLGDCLINPKCGERWLAFANDLHDYIEISSCGNATNLDIPFLNNMNFIPPPISENASKEMQLLLENSYKNKAYNHFLVEMNHLRSIRMSESLLNLKKEVQYKFNIVIGLFSLSVILLVVLILRKK